MAEKGRWHLIFGNENPIHIEIGMGKGQFIMKLAKEHPDINYIGIERYSSVLLRALQKMEIGASAKYPLFVHGRFYHYGSL